MSRSRFGVTGCLANPNMDNGKDSGGCSLETNIDSSGKVRQGGCSNSQTGGPGYKNESGFPPCCITDPPEKCITKSGSGSGSKTVTTETRSSVVTNCKAKVYADDNAKQMCEYQEALQTTYTPPPTIFNKPFSPVASTVFSPVASTVFSPVSSQVSRPASYNQPTPIMEAVTNWFSSIFGKSSFGKSSNNNMLIFILIAIGIFIYIKKRKGSGFGKRRRR
jgi:hypothetical protein